MHRFTAFSLRQSDDLLNIQIGPHAAPLQGQSLISAVPVQGLGVLRGVDCQAAQAGVQGGPGDADGNLPAVGD